MMIRIRFCGDAWLEMNWEGGQQVNTVIKIKTRKQYYI